MVGVGVVVGVGVGSDIVLGAGVGSNEGVVGDIAVHDARIRLRMM